MNERIKELEKQSVFYNDDDNFYFDRVVFAELIVRECMSICDAEKADYVNHRKAAFDFEEKNIYSEGAAASDTIKHKIKRSFGVE